jgi:hypothetical protein
MGDWKPDKLVGDLALYSGHPPDEFRGSGAERENQGVGGIMAAIPPITTILQRLPPKSELRRIGKREGADLAFSVHFGAHSSSETVQPEYTTGHVREPALQRVHFTSKNAPPTSTGESKDLGQRRHSNVGCEMRPAISNHATTVITSECI